MHLQLIGGYEASEQFWARIIMHMFIMRIMPIIMLSKRVLNMFGSLLSKTGLIVVRLFPFVNRLIYE